MNGGKILQQIKIDLRSQTTKSILPVWIDVFDNHLSRRWLTALQQVLENDYHLEKNYCFMGFVDHQRNGTYILDAVNRSIQAINQANIGYQIDDHFTMDNCITDQPQGNRQVGRNLLHDRFNKLHCYFEDLQGTSGHMSKYYTNSNAETRWHIRQLNLLCHEFESWALSYRKQIEAPEWQRPSQLMCWLNAPRFELEPADYELFGVDTINRGLGGVYVGVNKAVGKHHWEVFNDDGRDSRVSELTTSTLRSQTEAAADFDIEWGNDPGKFVWQQKMLDEFRYWLRDNGFDPEDPELTIGHPMVAQVDLIRSFGTTDYKQIWGQLLQHLDVASVTVGSTRRDYKYRYSDTDYQARQISILTKE